ncbi:PP2C family protein-serine/threonine phosphatase [Streptomyces sp. NPDC058620]|uniref:PP2C family protein-serine/threonine phosphatase n=1 Tax=Streptomyces sp. NPDC058620 TaxID=3346560 RepID=UPI0036484EC1
MPPLLRAVRRLARAYRLPADVRARLVLSVADLVEGQLQAGRTVILETGQEAGADADSYVLAVTLRCPQVPGPLTASGLPLPATKLSPGSVTWRFTIPLPPGRLLSSSLPDDVSSRRDPWPDRTPWTETEAVEEELRAAFARTDALGVEHRRLKHELAETNAGVLALYVQLEERDEQLRRAHSLIFQELEDTLRPPPLSVDGLELAVHYEPADAHAPTGGDLYDWFTLPDGTLHITVVDALGHGLGSTRSALDVTHTVRTLALEGHPLQSILARTHEILMPLAPDLMATVLLARLDPASGKLQLASGSHPPALLVPADGEALYLEAKGRGIGFPLPGSEQVLHADIGPGDLLILYTDGLTESRRDPIEGEKRLTAAARRLAARPLREIPSSLAAEMRSIVLHPDDTLALAIRMTRSDP